MIAVDTYSAASAVCRTASLMFGPYTSATLPFRVRDQAETVTLPEPAELARLLAEPRRRVPYTPPLGGRWMQPSLFDLVGVVS